MKKKTLNRKTMDRIMLVSWLALMIVNVISYYITRYFGGIIMVAVYWGFAMYFNFVYGDDKTTDTKYNARHLLVFLVLFFIEMQLLVNTSKGNSYTTMGVTFNMFVWQVLSSVVPKIYGCMGIVSRSNKEMLKWAGNIFKYLILFICATTLVILKTNPLASKLTAVGSVNLYVPFLAGYGLVYAMSTIVPVLLMRMEKERNKTFWIVSILAMVAAVFFASYFLAIIAMIVGVVCFFLLRVKNSFIRIGTISLFVLVVSYILVSDKIVDILLGLADIVPLEMLQIRLQETAQTFINGSTEGTAVRFAMYYTELKEFLRHPLTGNAIWSRDIVLSGHSTILDMLASGGLIVFSFYFLYFWSAHKTNLLFCPTQKEKAAAIASFISMMFVSTFNPVFSAPEVMMFFLLAVPLLFVNDKENSDQTAKGKFQCKYVRSKRF